MALTNADRLRAVMLALMRHSVFGEAAPSENLIDYFKKYTPQDSVTYTFSGQTYNPDAIPTMTSETTPSGTVTYSSQYSTTYAAWKAFDDSASTYWRTASPTEWIAYEFSSAKTIRAYTVYPTSTSYSPTAWTFEGWNGSSWVVLDTRSVAAFQTKTFFECANSTSYTKYRLNISAGTSTMRLYEVEMMEAE